MKWWQHWGVLCILLVAFALRLGGLDRWPVGMYWEELAVGYDAYSVWKTGKDHLGNPAPLVAFESFGDYKPALYFYAIIPFLPVFGLSAWSVRLPAALAGVAMVYGVGLLARVVARQLRLPWRVPKTVAVPMFQLLAMMIMAVSPWGLMFSRGGWEANLATCFLLYGVVAWVWPHQHKKWWWWAAGFICFGLAMYTYHAARVTAPLLALWLIIWRWHEELSVGNRHWLRVSLPYLGLGIGFLLFLSPLLRSLTGQQVQQRLAETSILADGHIIRLSNSWHETAGMTLWSRVFFHRWWLSFVTLSENFFRHVDGGFLFLFGDHNLRHSLQVLGQLYPFEVIFLFLGTAVLWKQQHGWKWFGLWWFCVALAPASLADAAPHALRTLAVLPLVVIVLALGTAECIGYAQRFWLERGFSVALAAVMSLYAISGLFFCLLYTSVYPQQTSQGWQYGYKEMVESILPSVSAGQTVYVLRSYDRPAMAYWFFTSADPQRVQALDKRLQKDQGEPLVFGSVHFVDDRSAVGPGIVASPMVDFQQLRLQGRVGETLKEIRSPNGSVVWVIYRLML